MGGVDVVLDRDYPLDFLPSDVAGRRLRNWIYAHCFFITLTRSPSVTAEFYERFLFSLWEQACYLRDHLSPARNHRTLELCTLFWLAVVFPEFRDSAQGMEFAKAELTRNMQTDLLPDGVQCELSLDYHHIVLRNYLSARRLSLLNKIPMPEEMDALIHKALRFWCTPIRRRARSLRSATATAAIFFICSSRDTSFTVPKNYSTSPRRAGEAKRRRAARYLFRRAATWFCAADGVRTGAMRTNTISCSTAVH